MGVRDVSITALVLLACGCNLATREALEGDVVHVVWVVRTEDCLSCNTPAVLLRELERLHPDRLSTSAVILGDQEDSALIESFLRRERLGSDVRFADLGGLADVLSSEIGLPIGRPKIRTVYVAAATVRGPVVRDFHMSEEEGVARYVDELLRLPVVRTLEDK